MAVKHQPKKKSRANAVAVAAVEPQADEEEHEIGNGFVELARMARQEIAVAGEDEAVVGASVFANDFRVHEVAEADAAGCDGRGDGDVVEHAEDVYLRAAHISQSAIISPSVPPWEASPA